MLFLLSPLTVFSQSEAEQLKANLVEARQSKEKSEILTKLTVLEMGKGNLKDAEKYANEALSLAESAPSANLLSQVGHIYQEKKQFAISLNYYLQALKEYEKSKDEVKLAEITEQVGMLYKNWGVNEKAVEYFVPAYQKYKKLDNQKAEIRVLSELIATNQGLGKLSKSLEYNKILLDIYRKGGNKSQEINALSNISTLHVKLSKPENALENQLEILELNKSLKDSTGISSALNNLGFLYKRLKQPEKALEHFEESMEYSADRNPVTLVNIGVMHQIMGRFEPSLLAFFEVAKIREQQQNDKEVARVCNYISAVYQTLDDTDNALRYTERAIQFGKKAESNETLTNSYKALSALYQDMWRNKRALEYYKLYADTKDAIQENSKKILQTELQKRVEAEKKENDLKLLLVDKEINQLSLTKLQLEAEKKEKALEFQLQEQALANSVLKQAELEKEKSLQNLILEKNKIEADKRQRDLAVLQANDKLQKLALKQNELEEAERQKDIELLKKENEIKDLLNKEQVEKQKAERRYFFYGLGSVLLILLLLLVGFILKQRDNAKLAKQKDEIAEKNDVLNNQNEELNSKNKLLQEQRDEISVQAEELTQQKDEIMAQRDYIEENNVALAQQKDKIEKAYNNITILSEIGQTITTKLDISAIVSTVYASINKLMDAPSFGIGVYNPNTNYLEFTDFIEKGEVLPYSEELYQRIEASFCSLLYPNGRDFYQ